MILVGNVVRKVKELEENSINCIVTSPPYFGLRSYGDIEGEIGNEQTPQKYIANLVDVFSECLRILKPDGTMWLNISDSYAGSGGNNTNYPTAPNSIDKRPGNVRGSRFDKWNSGTNGSVQVVHSRAKTVGAFQGLKRKELMFIPQRLAMALQVSGWYIRQEIIWQKPTPMPESMKDRCARSHEYIYLCTKSPDYFYNWQAIATQAKDGSGRLVNRRSVWNIGTANFKGEHYATMPFELAERCILAGCSDNGIVFDPFLGAGTTAIAAIANKRKWLGCEINPDYAGMAKARISQQQIKLF